MVFDFRLLHRGLPNTTPHTRPIAYAVVGRGGARDEVNFPDLSLRESVAAMEAAGLEGEELDLFRKGVGGQFPTWLELARSRSGERPLRVAEERRRDLRDRS